MLEVVTRHLTSRPRMLRFNQQSLERLCGGDWIQTVIVDDVGIGIERTHENFRSFTPSGDYVWILDDDDECILPSFVVDLEKIIQSNSPDAVVVRMDHGRGLGILPNNGMWGKTLHRGLVGCSALISSRDTWMKNREAWGSSYSGDFDYVHSVQSSVANLFWWDVVASRARQQSYGAGE